VQKAIHRFSLVVGFRIEGTLASIVISAATRSKNCRAATAEFIWRNLPLLT
jgi:hypothetical protein